MVVLTLSGSCKVKRTTVNMHAGKSAGLIMRRIHPGCMAEARVLLMEQTVTAMGALSLDALPNPLLAPPVAAAPVALPATVSHSLQPARRPPPAYACSPLPGIGLFVIMACTQNGAFIASCKSVCVHLAENCQSRQCLIYSDAHQACCRASVGAAMPAGA